MYTINIGFEWDWARANERRQLRDDINIVVDDDDDDDNDHNGENDRCRSRWGLPLYIAHNAKMCVCVCSFIYTDTHQMRQIHTRSVIRLAVCMQAYKLRIFLTPRFSSFDLACSHLYVNISEYIK